MNGRQPENPDDRGENGTPRPDGASPLHAVAGHPEDAVVGRSLALVRYLRRHCPWDASRTAETLRPYLLEEAHEVADCILDGTEEELAAELGDLLLNVAFQIVVAEERDAFDARTVVEQLESKMRKRHPHVYGDAAQPPDWERMKARERRGGPTSEDGGGVSRSLEPLSRAYRMQQRAAAMGFDWPSSDGALDKVREELGEVAGRLPERVAAGEQEPAGDSTSAPSGDADAGADAATPDPRLREEVGDLLFAAVNVARMAGVHPSTALSDANRKFERRFSGLLERARRQGTDLEEAPLESLEALWEAAKDEARQSPEETGPPEGSRREGAAGGRDEEPEE